MRAICCAILALVFLLIWIRVTITDSCDRGERILGLLAEILCFVSVCAAVVLCILGL